MKKRKPQWKAPGSKRTWTAVITVVALIIVAGLAPALVIVIGGIAIPIAALAGVWLAAKRYGAVNRLLGGGR